MHRGQAFSEKPVSASDRFKTRTGDAKEKSFECSKVCRTSRIEGFFSPPNRCWNGDAVRRNNSHECTGSMNLWICLREFLRFEGLGLNFAVTARPPYLRTSWWKVWRKGGPILFLSVYTCAKFGSRKWMVPPRPCIFCFKRPEKFQVDTKRSAVC